MSHAFKPYKKDFVPIIFKRDKPMTKPTPEKQNEDTAEMFKHIANFGGGPANPMQMQWGMTDGIPNIWFAVGLTKREKIAAMIMAAFISGEYASQTPEEIADDAVKHADALLERLKK